jgi:hypothetical protein
VKDPSLFKTFKKNVPDFLSHGLEKVNGSDTYMRFSNMCNSLRAHPFLNARITGKDAREFTLIIKTYTEQISGVRISEIHRVCLLDKI